MSIYPYVKFIASYIELTRFVEWRDKVVLLVLSSFFIAFFSLEYIPSTLYRDMVIFILYIFPAFSFGYVINSYSDRATDLQLGRDLFFGFSKFFVTLSLILFFVLSVVFASYFNNTYIHILNFIILGSAFLYSVKPVRLKERGYAGIFSSALVQYSPILLLGVIYKETLFFALYLYGWLTILGVLKIITHQIGDYENDRQTGTSTYVTERGRQKAAIRIYTAVGVLLLYMASSFFFYFNGHGILLILLLLLSSSETFFYVYNRVILVR